MTLIPDPQPLPERQNVTIRDFADDILPAGQPVVMRGLVNDWPAVRAAREGIGPLTRHVARFDAGAPVEVIYGDADIGGRFFYNEDLTGLNFLKRDAKIADALAELVAGAAGARDEGGIRSVYLQSIPTHGALPGFAEANRLALLPPQVEPRIWIGGPLTVQTHYDLSENIACVAAGRRRFTLFPPDQLPNLYPGPMEMTLAGPPVSMVRLEEPDLRRFPRFAEAMGAALTAELGPGDAIFVPYAWWHHVQSLSPLNVLVNYWWGGERTGGSPYDALLHAILAVRDLPERRRGVWHGMFEHYVFGANGDPAAHLPDHAKGTLGPHDAKILARGWTALAQATTRQAQAVIARMGGGPR